MRHLVALILLLGPLAGAASAQATPRSIGDCERIKGDLAYNQCLAMFGPKAHTKAASAEVGSVPAAVAAQAASAGAAAAVADEAPAKVQGRRGRSGRYSYRGRSRAVFTVGSTSRSSYRRTRRR
jgi:hypothetical protein